MAVYIYIQFIGLASLFGSLGTTSNRYIHNVYWDALQAISV